MISLPMFVVPHVDSRSDGDRLVWQWRSIFKALVLRLVLKQILGPVIQPECMAAGGGESVEWLTCGWSGQAGQSGWTRWACMVGGTGKTSFFFVAVPIGHTVQDTLLDSNLHCLDFPSLCLCRCC